MEFRNLDEHNVPQPEIALFNAFYSSQSGAAHGSRAFNIQRGVKQVDILSPMFFNVVLECALRKWKGKCQHCGIAMDHHEWRTSVKYADDLMLYARSLPVRRGRVGSTSSQDNRLGKIQPTHMS